MKRNYNVDFLRFFLALAVILCHAFYVSQNSPDPIAVYTHDVVNIGAAAVAIFFAFSGFYVTASLVRKGDKNFIKNRLARLLPELWIVILISIFIIGPVLTDMSISEYLMNPGTWIYLLNAFLIPWHNLPGVFSKNIYGSVVNGSLWTLPVEFVCYIYLLIAKKLKLLDKRRFKYFYLISVVLAVAAYTTTKHLGVFVIFSMTRPFVSFITAVALYLYYDLDKISFKKYGVMLLIMVVSIIINHELLLNIAIYVIWPILVLGVTSKLRQVPEKFAKWGELSYAIYLVGFVVQQCLVHIFGGRMNPWLNFALASVISIATAIVINKLAMRLFDCKKINKNIKNKQHKH